MLVRPKHNEITELESAEWCWSVKTAGKAAWISSVLGLLVNASLHPKTLLDHQTIMGLLPNCCAVDSLKMVRPSITGYHTMWSSLGLLWGHGDKETTHWPQSENMRARDQRAKILQTTHTGVKQKAKKCDSLTSNFLIEECKVLQVEGACRHVHLPVRTLRRWERARADEADDAAAAAAWGGDRWRI